MKDYFCENRNKDVFTNYLVKFSEHRWRTLSKFSATIHMYMGDLYSNTVVKVLVRAPSTIIFRSLIFDANGNYGPYDILWQYCFG